MTHETIDNVKIVGTLNVTGAVDLDSTLNVDGAATFQTTVTIDQILKALDAAGIQLQDDGGNIALTAIDGGIVVVGMATTGGNVFGGKAGASTNDWAGGGDLYVDTTQRANGTTVETDLGSYSVPANTLAVNNQWIEVIAAGTVAANGNTKTIKIYFGSESWTVASSTFGSAAGTWLVHAYIYRTGATTQKVVVDPAPGTDTVTTASRTLSSANIVKITGQGGASNDILEEVFTVAWHDANT